MKLGLTGSIGMGKSTTARMFAEAGLPVWDADATVHRLYAPGGAAVPVVADLCPAAVHNGAVDRAALRAAILADDGLLSRLEAAVHPLVAADRTAFQAAHAESLCDVPLLFETGSEAAFDRVIVVTAPAAVQRARVMARPGMTEAAFDTILARQMPDREKRARADHLVWTHRGLVDARRQVHSILREVRRHA